MGQVTAGWALYGKRPGSSDDYSVLNCSLESFSKRSSYERILYRYGLGTPLAARTGEGALPWVAVSWVGEESDRKIGMSVEEWTDHRDGAGRPVSFTKYVCVPYRQLETAPVSYGALYREVSRLDLPMDGEPGADTVLTLPDYDPDALARDIERFGTERVMLAAAMLLDGNVDVVQAGEASIWDRLAFLDAVVALLPYGYRAAFTGGTWATGSADNIRLLFARRARTGSRELAWRGPDEQPRLSETAREYLRRLHGLLNFFPDLSGLVAYLAQETTLCDFRDPRHALQRAADVRWPRDVAAAVRSGTARTDDTRRLLGSTRLHELSQADRGGVLEHVVRAADPDDLELIEQRWDELASAGATGDLTGALAAAATALLWRDEPDKRVSRYLEVARRRNFLAWFLGELVRHGTDSGLEGPGYRAARTLAATLIRDHVDPFAPGAARSPLVRQAGRDREIVTALLVEEPAGQRRVAAWVGWLESEIPDLMGHFRTVLENRNVGVDDLRGLARGEPVMAVALVWVAARLELLGHVLPAMLGWLGERGEPSAQARELATAALSRADTPDFRARGASDAVLLMLGSSARHLDGAVGNADFPDYHDGFCWAWDVRPTEGMARMLVRQLTVDLRSRPWAGAPDRADDVINLARSLVRSADLDWEPLRWVLAADPPDEALARRPSYGELRRLLVPNETAGPAAHGGAPAAFGADPSEQHVPSPTYLHGAVPFEHPAGGNAAQPASGPAMTPVHMYGQENGTALPSTEGALARIGPDSGMEEVAAAYLDAVLTGTWADQALGVLVEKGRRLSTDEILELVRRVEYGVARRYDDGQAAGRVYSLVRAVVGGALGGDSAEEFRHAYGNVLSEQIENRAGLLETLGLGDDSWQPAEHVRARLDRGKKKLDEMVKQSRGGLFGRGGRNRKSGDG